MRSLNWLNFLVADINTAFGPFVPVALIQAGWSPAWVGYAVGAGGLAALAGQVPAGALIDATRHKRTLAALALLGLAGAALIVACLPMHLPVMLALLLQGVAGVILGPTIAAVTLSMSKRGALGERLGRNARWQALGAGGAALMLGALGRQFGPRAVFLAAAALAIPALLAVRGLGGTVESGDKRPPGRGNGSLTHLLRDRRISAFFVCTLLFFAGNAAILTLVADRFAAADPAMASLLVPAAVMVPQGLVALLSPRIGRLAQRWGRRPILLLGFAMVPLRAVLFALGAPPAVLVAYQALDGIGAAVLGVMLPLIVADLTRDNGRFNLVFAGLGLAGTAGTAISNLMSGCLLGTFGAPTAFLALAATGVLAMSAVAFVMPETGLPELGLPEMGLKVRLRRIGAPRFALPQTTPAA